MLAKRLFGSAILGALVALPVTFAGCGDELCCTEFEPGAAVDVNIGGSVESQLAVQALADFSGTASGMIDDLSNACLSIATDLDASSEAIATADATEDKAERMQALCSLAVSAIGTVKGSASIEVAVVPPQCSVSVSAKLGCEANCNVDASCDVKATPPTCEGGSLTVACKGGCTAEAGASVSCTGTCTGSCEGSCTVETGGVECAGKCEGTCKGAAEGGTGEGIKADGTCAGTCEGTCEVVAPGASCSGSCSGSCSATCQGSAEASVQCDGSCDAEFEPLSCTGGELKAGCEVDAECSANCDASASAKAECTPPEVGIKIAGNIEANSLGKLKATLEKNFKVVYAVQARLELIGGLAGTLSGNITAVADIKAVCIPVVVASAATAAEQVAASVSVTGSLVGSIGG